MRHFSNERNSMRSLTLSDFTLRNHKEGITALQIIEIPSASIAPALLSGDSHGVFVMWNLVTKRPLTCTQIEDCPHIISFQWVESTNVLCILCKDSMLRMFELSVPAEESMDLVSRQHQSNNARDLQWTLIYEMPINTLNFANFIVDAQAESKTDNICHRLICCHTNDSEAIDIYHIIQDSTFKLQRPFSNLNFPGFLKQQNLSELPKDSKFGIIMRFAKLNDIIFLGFENGYIIGFTTTFDEELQKGVAELVHISDDHYPNPILNMCVRGDELYSCSTDDFITKHKLSVNPRPVTNWLRDSSLSIKCSSRLKVTEPSRICVPLKNISHINRITDSYLLISSWSGKTIVLNVHTSEVLQTFMKTKNSLVVTDSSIGGLTNDNSSSTESNLRSNNYKVGSMTGLKSFEVQSDGLKLGELRRIKALAEYDWCIIGYDDGTIKLNKI
ncbi:YPR085C [Saccharomyces arboricola H-6]|uniref:YPR085C n=1 Tax=Saccharomyces arboricola (strain H-6 / AS 2.3317 / CBS 10644) TaxID=1160507 RepID=J8LGT4_SACAR|nr:YPR085C [Saccharomyces arboricola H-6]